MCRYTVISSPHKASLPVTGGTSSTAGAGVDNDDLVIQEAASLLASLSDTLQSPLKYPPPQPYAPSSSEVSAVSKKKP